MAQMMVWQVAASHHEIADASIVDKLAALHWQVLPSFGHGGAADLLRACMPQCLLLCRLLPEEQVRPVGRSRLLTTDHVGRKIVQLVLRSLDSLCQA